MEEQLQLEETQRTNQQSQDQIPHDPNALSDNPDGYTSVPDVVAQTPVEEVDPINVGQVEVTTPQQEGANSNEVFGGSGNIPVLGDNSNINPLTGVQVPNGYNNPEFLSNDVNPISNIISSVADPGTEDQIVDPEEPPVTPDPEDPEEPENPDPEDPEEPENPDPEDPDPENPDPEDPNPENPDPENPDPEDPDPEDPDPEDPDPEDPDPEDPDPEDPDPEGPGKGNPGNDKEVGNSPWDGETGASNQPGKGNHQDGQDPETNQPPGDSKNDGGKENNSGNDNGNGGGGGDDLQRGQNNGFGNCDQDAPGNSLNRNNAENDQDSLGDYVDRFVRENPGDHWHGDIPFDNDIDMDHNDISDILMDENVINIDDYSHSDQDYDYGGDLG